MNMILVVPDGNKFKVLVNFVQEGISYASKVLADQEARKLQEKSTNKKVS